jgi:predicted Ser/Thr protein kinase
MSEPTLLDRLQEQVVDGDPVDWAALSRYSLTPDDGAQIEFLRLLDQLALAHTSMADDGRSDETGGRLPAGVQAEPDGEGLRTWGRYRLEERVGRGGFGSVYRAWDPQLEMPVAIKILHPRPGDDDRKTRLLHEGRVLAPLRHPNVVRVLNVERNEGRRGLVMEFLRGETLEAHVAAHGPMNDREAMVVVEDVCRALAAVHATGLIHRDVKARNIMRERSGRIVLMDFGAGLSQEFDDGRTVGTPFYMAPELFAGAPATVVSDVYAVGVLMFYLVTGEHPYVAATTDELRRAQLRGAPRSVLDVRPDLSLGYARIVARALTVEPGMRYRSAASLLHDLNVARDGAPAWKKRLIQGTTLAAGVAVAATIGGMLSVANFNRTLGRAAFADDGVIEWLQVGVRSLATPIVLTLMSAGVVGILAACRRLALVMSNRARTGDRWLVEGCRSFGRRLSLDDPAISGCWLLLLSAVAAVGAVVAWADLLAAVRSTAGSASHDTLKHLSPAYQNAQLGYRWGLSGLAAANLLAFAGMLRSSRRRGRRLPQWLVGAEAAFVVLLYGAMQVPYVLMNDSDQFPAVTWNEARCHVIGSRADRSLLFCPLLNPRHVDVDAATALPPADAAETDARPITDAEAAEREARKNVFYLFGATSGGR